MTRDELEEKSKPELIKLGESMGISISPGIPKGDMVSKILGEHVEQSKEVEPPLPPEGKLRTLDGEPIPGRMYRVTILETDSDKGDVFLAVNGYGVQVQRGKEVLLHEAYVEVLNNSVIRTVDKDPNTGKETPRSVMTYPFTAVAA